MAGTLRDLERLRESGRELTLADLAARFPTDFGGAYGATTLDDVMKLGDDPFARGAYRTARGVKSPMKAPADTTTGLPKWLEDFIVPQTPLDVAMYAIGGPAGKLAKTSAVALGGLLTSGEAEAGPAKAVEKLLKLGRRAPEGGGQFPGIYKRPDVIASEAAAQVAPEHPALQKLFGVDRQDLYDISQHGRRQGNILQPPFPPGKGSYVAEGIMTPGNEKRILDAMAESQKYPEFYKGMDAWYVMDPAFQQMVKLVGPEQAIKDYKRFNTFTSMASPSSDVLTEINRGTGAHMMAARGEFPLFKQYGGMKGTEREALGARFPEVLRDVVGHPHHSTAHVGPMEKYLQGGAVDMKSAKVPLYIQASGVPETGFQTRFAVPDAHFGRFLGVADVRAAHGHQNPGTAMRVPEYSPMSSWFRERIAEPMGLEGVPAQGRMWGLGSPQTGVDTPIGAPKLELLAQRIWERAQKLGIDPKKLRDDVLTGKAHASWLIPALAAPGAFGREE